MNLNKLLEFDEIVIQCHDHPDADAIASGFALYSYLINHYKKPRLIYSGPRKITKPNLLIMIEKLNIPIDYVEALDKPELLITVDCHYAEGNVQTFDAKNYAVIDHHICTHSKTEMIEVREGYGSCSTILAQMLIDAGFDYNYNTNIATALYYGLYSDTNGFMELKHPADRDLRDFANYDKLLIPILRNSNLSKEELEIAGEALKSIKCNSDYRFAVSLAKPCDPNILGFISDLVLQVDSVDTSIVCCISPLGVKLSVRSCVNEIRAGELVDYVTKGIGNGGGHQEKAGGFIKFSLACDINENNIVEFLSDRMTSYQNSFEVIKAENYYSDSLNLPKYEKIPNRIGYVKTIDILPNNTPICVRSLEAEFEIVASPDIYIIIGKMGNIHPIKKEKFDKTYSISDEKYVYENKIEYQPKLISGSTYYEIIPYAHSCIPKPEIPIYAHELNHDVKLYTKWDSVNYMLGKKGDFIAVRTDDTGDAYIIKKDIFNSTYKLVD